MKTVHITVFVYKQLMLNKTLRKYKQYNKAKSYFQKESN